MPHSPPSTLPFTRPLSPAEESRRIAMQWEPDSSAAGLRRQYGPSFAPARQHLTYLDPRFRHSSGPRPAFRSIGHVLPMHTSLAFLKHAFSVSRRRVPNWDAANSRRMVVYQPVTPGGPMAWCRDTLRALSNMQCSHFFIRLHISGAGSAWHGIAWHSIRDSKVPASDGKSVRMWEFACFGCHDGSTTEHITTSAI